jgi:hypothetical protein
MGPRRKGRKNDEAAVQRRVDAFLAWMRSVGIWWDEELLSIEAGGFAGCSGVALGVRARAEVGRRRCAGRRPRRRGRAAGGLSPSRAQQLPPGRPRQRAQHDGSRRAPAAAARRGGGRAPPPAAAPAPAGGRAAALPWSARPPDPPFPPAPPTACRTRT